MNISLNAFMQITIHTAEAHGPGGQQEYADSIENAGTNYGWILFFSITLIILSIFYIITKKK